MSLIRCPECGKRKVSSTAEACPKCGFAIRKYFEKNSLGNKHTGDSGSKITTDSKLEKTKKEHNLPNFFKRISNRKVLIVLLILVVIGGAAYVVIHDLTAEFIFYSNKHGILMESGTDIKFTVEYDRKPYLFGGMDLYCDGVKIGHLSDDGKNGDPQANDGLFSFTNYFDGQEKPYEIYAKDTFHTSDTIRIHSFDELKTEDYEDYLIYNEAVGMINDSYISDDGYIANAYKSSVLSDIYETAHKFMEKGTIIAANKSGDSVSVQFSSGLISTYSPNIRDMKSGGKGMSIIEIHPFNTDECKNFRLRPSNKNEQIAIDIGEMIESYSAFFPWDKGEIPTTNYHLTSIGSESAGKMLDDQFDNIYYLQNIVGTEVDPLIMEKLGADQIIVWDGHGDYNSMTNSEILLAYNKLDDSTEELDTNALAEKLKSEFSDKYEKYLREGKLELCGIYEDYDEDKDILYLWKYYVMFGITPAFIHDSDLNYDDSIVYLSACHSAHSMAFLEAFVTKGAQCVVGFPVEVSVGYSDELLLRFFNYLGRIDSGTNKCYSVGDAIKKAVKDNGYYSHEDENGKKQKYQAIYMISHDSSSYTLGDNPDHKNLTNYVDQVSDFFTKKGEEEQGYFSGTYNYYTGHKQPFRKIDDIKEFSFSGKNRVQMTTFDGQIISGSYKVFDDRELVITFDDPNIPDENPDICEFKLADKDRTLFIYDEYLSEGVYELVDN